MLEKIREPKPPSGLKLKLFRLVIYLYRWELGFLLRERFILLQHRGRVSGLGSNGHRSEKGRNKRPIGYSTLAIQSTANACIG